MATPSEIAQILDHWRSTGVPLNAGASPEQIAGVERECGLTIPEPLRLLYQEANGMREGESDSQFFYLWPVEQAASESRAWGIPADASTLPFGDFLAASHAYCVRCAGPEM